MIGSRMRRAASGLLTTDPPAPGGMPLDIDWHAAFWAEDPDWTNPGDGNSVASWKNAGSGDFGNATQGTASLQPIFHSSDAAFNGKPVVQGDTSDDYLVTGAGTEIAQPNTWVVIAASTSGSEHIMDGRVSGRRTTVYRWQNLRWFAGDNRSPGVNLGTDGTSPHLVVAEANGSSSVLEIDGTQEDAGNIGTNGLDGVTLFSFVNGGGGYGGKIAFAGIYNGTLTSQEKADILAWSRSHYATP